MKADPSTCYFSAYIVCLTCTTSCHTHTHVHMHAYMHTRTHIHTHARTCTHTHDAHTHTPKGSVAPPGWWTLEECPISNPYQTGPRYGQEGCMH